VPARNIYHDAVVDALVSDGWLITDDPLTLSFGGKDVYVDLGAQRTAIGAERAGRRIAVEVHSFLLPSPVRDLQEAIGQYEMYRAILDESGSDRHLFLAVPQHVYNGLLSEPFGQLRVTRIKLRLVVFDDLQRRIVRIARLSAD